MHEFIAKTLESAGPVLTSLTLPYDLRQKSRQRVTLDNGEEAALFLARGTVLYHEDRLRTGSGDMIRVLAAEELLSVVECDDMLLFARACYHLGNRHMPLQIEKNRLAYLHDHVLDDMLRGLGLVVLQYSAPFTPEPGAYGGRTDHEHGH